MDAWERSRIRILREAGRTRTEIWKKFTKRDGTHPALRTVDNVLEKKERNPGWRGEDSQAGGRPRELTGDERKQLVDLVFRSAARPW